MSHATQHDHEAPPAPPIDDLGERLSGLQTMLEDLDTRARDAIQERPLVALGMALAFGYLLGRALVRK